MEKTTRSGAAHRMASGVLADLAEFAHSLARSLFDPYRPELYYMRGPGPKWHAKHDRAPVAYQAIRGGHSDRERGRPWRQGNDSRRRSGMRSFRIRFRRSESFKLNRKARACHVAGELRTVRALKQRRDVS